VIQGSIVYDYFILLFLHKSIEAFVGQSTFCDGYWFKREYVLKENKRLRGKQC